MRWNCTIIVFALLLVSCGPQAADRNPTTSADTERMRTAAPSTQALPSATLSAPLPTQVGERITPHPGADGAPLELARADLARRLGVDETAVTLLSIERVQWSDSCLGCAGPDMVCLMALTEGYRILLAAEGTTYPYHSDTRGHILLCQNGQPSYPVVPLKPGRIQDGQPWLPVGTPIPESAN